MAKKRTVKQNKARLTIGYLAPAITGGSLDQWLGVVDAALKQDVNLISFPGSSPRNQVGFNPQANILYELVTANHVDGLLTWASAIGNHISLEELQAFHERYRPLPVVTIGRTLEGFPSLLMDSYLGMREAVTHLIEVHGCRRLVFIRGPEGHFYAQERYRAYLDTLEAHGIPFAPNLVSSPGPWGTVTATAAMQLLLDERKLRPQADFDAIVAANDNLLITALAILQSRGVRAPRDVACVGFDNREEGRTSTPPFTTVAAPFYEVGYQGVETLLALIKGERVPDEATVPSRLVVRRSCGCESAAVLRAAAEMPSAPSSKDAGPDEFEVALTAQREGVAAVMTQTMEELGLELASTWAEELLEGFAAELKEGKAGAFLAALESVLQQVEAESGDDASRNVAAMQNVVSALRRNLLPYLGEMLSQAEDLWQQARVLIGETAQRAQARERAQADTQTQALRDIGAALITAFDVAELMDTLAARLPQLGIPRCYFSLYENPRPYVYPQPAPEWSSLMLAYADAERPAERIDLPSGGLRFQSQHLVPQEIKLLREKPYNIVVEPLYFRENQLGFALLEAGLRQAEVYNTLRGEISSALYGALRVQQTRDRAFRLQTTAEVSRAASSILDPDELIQQVVDLVQERLDLYYAGLFLVDEAGSEDEPGGGWAVLRAATGEAGQQMLAQGHRLEVGGESMIGWCVANKQARIALDVGEDAVRFENPFLPGTRSELALPLVSRGQAIGALTIQSAQEAAFSDEDIAVLQTMADQLANTIANARLFEQAQAHTEEFAVLNEMARALTVTLDVDTVLQNVYHHTSRLMDASNLYVALYDAQKDEVSFPFYLIEGEPIAHVESRRAGKGLTEYVLRTRQPFLVAENIAAQLKELGIEMVGREAQSWLGAPMVTGDQVVGVIAVQSYTTPRVYNEHHRDLLSAIANQTAIAIQNTRLFDEQQQASLLLSGRVKELDLLNEIGREIDSSPQVLDLLRWVAERLPSAMRYSDECLAAIEFAGQIYGTAEAIGLPCQMVGSLRVGGERVGQVIVAYTEEHVFLDEESALLGDVVRRLAGYVENRRLFERMQDALAEVEATQRRYLEQVWTEYLRSARATGYETGQVGGAPLDDALLREAQQAVERQRTIALTGNGGAAEERSALVAPVTLRGLVIGALGVHDKSTRQWTEEEIALIEAVAERVALAAENLRLLDETQRRAARERAVAEVSARISESLDLERVLMSAASEMRQVLGLDDLVVRLIEPEAD